MGPVVPDTDLSVVVCGVSPSCSSSLVHVHTAAVCPSTAVFNSSRGFVQVCQESLLVQPTIHSSPLCVARILAQDLSCMYMCVYRESSSSCRYVPLIPEITHTLSRTASYVGGEILFPLRLLLRTCRYVACCTASIPKACMYIHYTG